MNDIDKAWQFFENKIAEGYKKKDIVPLLNDAGYTTKKGRPWTYQTILLEQRKRGKGRSPNVIGGGGDGEQAQGGGMSALNLKVVDQSILNESVQMSSEKDESVDLKLLRQRVESGLQESDLQEVVSGELVAGVPANEIADILNDLGYVDPKGHLWHEISLSYHFANALIKGGSELEVPKGNLLDILDRNKPRESDRSQSVYELRRREMWRVMDEELAKGTKKKKLVGLLNLGGFQTKRGRSWTYQTLIQELKVRPLFEAEDGGALADLEVDGDPLAFAKRKIQSEILPKMEHLRTSRGGKWSYENLLWELLKADLVLE
jgi:hypothetical protein